jgi:hypothetical protein
MRVKIQVLLIIVTLCVAQSKLAAQLQGQIRKNPLRAQQMEELSEVLVDKDVTITINLSPNVEASTSEN